MPLGYMFRRLFLGVGRGFKRRLKRPVSALRGASIFRGNTAPSRGIYALGAACGCVGGTALALSTSLQWKQDSTLTQIYSTLTELKHNFWLRCGPHHMPRFGFPFAVCEAQASEPPSKESRLTSRRREIVGNYENRVREMSNPKKIFEYFASKSDENGNMYMSPYDFIRSVTAYAERSSDEVGNRGPVDSSSTPHIGLSTEATRRRRLTVPRIFRALTGKRDGVISLKQYILFTTLLAIPPRDFEVVFRMMDSDGNGYLVEGEFNELMSIMYQHSPVSRSLRPMPKDIRELIPRVPAFFGSDGMQKLTLEEFKTHLASLRKTVLKVQFSMINDGADKISAHAFAQHISSLVTTRNAGLVGAKTKMLVGQDKGVAPEHLRRQTYDFADFLIFHEIIACANALNRAVDLFVATGRDCTETDFSNVVWAVTGKEINSAIIDLLFFIFDADSSGSLDYNEFLGTLHTSSFLGLGKHRDVGVARSLRCISKCRKARERGLPFVPSEKL